MAKDRQRVEVESKVKTNSKKGVSRAHSRVKNTATNRSRNASATSPSISAVSVCGYKSLFSRQRVELGGLTVFAGANSSGKSSMMQPLLLLKQTLDAPYDPGSLLLNGPNVRLTSAGQLLSRQGRKSHAGFFVEAENDKREKLRLTFKRVQGKGLSLDHMTYAKGSKSYVIGPNSSENTLVKLISYHDKFIKQLVSAVQSQEPMQPVWKVERERCFYNIALEIMRDKKAVPVFRGPVPLWGRFQNALESIIHVPGLRGNPERTYKTTAVGNRFPGTFESYVASLINHWQAHDDPRVATVGSHLETLGLTWIVRADQVDDTQVELKVGRLTQRGRSGKSDLVSIADVGFGLSQVLPVVVALLAAEKGQIVYLEQPEIHLHPRAQYAIADLLVQATNRGVSVVIETHSALLLLGIQTLVAQKKIASQLVKLHWFRRERDGATKVTSAVLDAEGTFGEWPEDFGEVILKAQSDFLDATEEALSGKHNDQKKK
jgi:hypothetical protein